MRSTNITYSLLLFGSVLSSSVVEAYDSVRGIQESPQRAKEAALYNQDIQSRPLLIDSDIKPVAELDNFSFLLLGADNLGSPEFDNFYEKIAENLPDGVRLVVFINKGKEHLAKTSFARWIDPSRTLFAISKQYSMGTWARDAFPIPVRAGPQGQTQLVAAKYPRYTFTGHFDIADAVAAPFVRQENFFIVGGNLMADHESNCFVVESPRLYDLSDSTLKAAYGCKEVYRLEYLRGIGDVDEVVKILPNKEVLVTISNYDSLFESLGYRVTYLPDAGDYRTYANSILIDNVAYVPSFGGQKDAQAKAIYESKGFRVVMIRSNYFSDNMRGSLHCMSMAYPSMDLSELGFWLNAEISH